MPKECNSWYPNRRTRIARRLRHGWIMITLTLAVASTAYADLCADLRDTSPSIHHVQEGMQRHYRFPVRVQRIALGAPAIADVEAINTQSFLLTAKSPGATSLMVWTRCSEKPHTTVVIVGSASTASAIGAVSEPISRHELPSQVQTDIRMVEVSRTKLREVGTSLLSRQTSAQFLFGSPGVLGGVAVSPGGVGAVNAGITGSKTGFNIFYGGGSKNVLAMLNALETSGFAYTLAEPSLVALSGQSATFLAGGEFPIPVPSGRADVVTIEYKEFGVRLSLTPTILDADRISLKVAPEVSELDFNAGIQSGGVTVPALRVRRTDTTVTLGNGESFVISGLVSTNTIANVDKLPGLGDIPILGAFFRSSRLEAEDRELLMVVTPHLVRPLAKTASMPDLPWESLRNYRPGVFEMLFLEDGSFKTKAPNTIGQSE